MPLPCPPRPLPVLASALAAAGIVLTVASCSHITPLGPDPTQLPPPTASGVTDHRASHARPAPHGNGPVPGRLGRGLPAGRRRAAHHRRGRPRRPAGPVVTKGASAPPPPAASPAVAPHRPPPPPPSTPITCYRPAGTPVTITSAAVSSVLTYRPPPGQATGPDLYGFIVGVPGANVAAVTAVIRQAYDTGSAVGISVAGKLWQAPQVFQPFPGQRLQITLLSRNQARQLHRMLVPSG